MLNYLSEWPKEGPKRADAVDDDGYTMNTTGLKIGIDHVSKQWRLK
ncbi:hypothetical protein NIE88_04210 [Sporolactobacillus shoreicorticis]|uniref:Transposase n=1 Tax=Sporolactobacillus shoreicorticis TaxID=1923877 RepID=A0ABW5S1H2_9BACL|nr:hypothetical protein [Sporolactobacillus shoreicorticis]MCO7124978.1 hypothetical protein [Sporolactobacillus shoreicorticis]